MLFAFAHLRTLLYCDYAFQVVVTRYPKKIDDQSIIDFEFYMMLKLRSGRF